MEKILKKVLIMAGGTGGHIFPGLALANYLKEKDVEVHWLGTTQGLESRLIPQNKIPLHLININGLRGKGIKILLVAPWRLSKAFWQSFKILRAIKPDVIIGMGGYVAGPGGIASWCLGLPLVIHEQNAKPGFTNKILAYFSKKILEGFSQTFHETKKVIVTGNPVRFEIETLTPPIQRLVPYRTPFRLLILGGSLGAQAINMLIPQVLTKMAPEERPEIYHQAGEKNIESTKQAYIEAGIQANVVPFIEDIAKAYGWADMVLCRAGASTVAELCSAGLGAILIPFPYAVDDHQTANANYMVKHHAAICIQQADLTAQRLVDLLQNFTQFPEQRLKMAEAAYHLRYSEVPKRIFGILCELCAT